MRFLCPLESLIGMFQRLFGILVSSLVIFFPVVRGGSTVCARGEFVEFGGPLVRDIWNSLSHPRPPLHARTIAIPKLFNSGHLCRGYALSN
jgi:hypothetical protein